MKHTSLFIFIALLLCIINAGYAQNTAITDDDAYTADPSAMLDVKSLTKGLLVPRLTSAQRTAISSPANGLLVYDITANGFYFYKSGTGWIQISQGQIWEKSGNNVYLSDINNNVGIGTASPGQKLIVKADATNGLDESIFAVLNTNGDTVFAVYPEGVRVWVNDAGGTKANGSRGGFAVGGLSPAKGITNEYFRVTPDSVRVYIDDSFVASKANGSRGGFAVGGFSPAKGSPTDQYFFVQDDSTRVWTDGDGGFEVRDLATSSTNYLDLNPGNYFIGHNCGQLSTGTFNIFLGYNAGQNNTSGTFNVFEGYQSGRLNTTGHKNVFIGYQAGYNNFGDMGSSEHGSNNVFIGMETGRANTSGYYNTLLGSWAGYSNTTGKMNTIIGCLAGYATTTAQNQVFIGYYAGANTTGADNTYIGSSAGYTNTTGQENVFIGTLAGYSNNGTGNVFLGYNAGLNQTTASNKLFIHNTGTNSPLIYGDFLTANLVFNGSVRVTNIFYDSSGDAGIAGQILSSTGIGTNWINAPASITGSGTATQVAFWNGTSSLTGSNNLYWNNTSSRLGIGTSSPTESLHATGGIRIGAAAASNAGTIQWNGSDFYGYNGASWVSLTAQGTVTGSGTATQVAFWNGATALSGNSNLYWNNSSAYLGVGTATPSYKVHAVNLTASNDDPAVYGEHAVTDYYGVGVRGVGRYVGVDGSVTTASSYAHAIRGYATGSGTAITYGLYGSSTGGSIAYGIYATASGASTNYAGYFQGNVHVNGTLSKSAGTFRIDHPLDPENKYLVHSFVESPDMKNVYDGVTVIDNNGQATVQLPGYFEALNKDFRYQLTTIGGYAPVYIDQEIQNGQFIIAGGTPGMKVSWQVTGIRKDPYAVANPVIVEEEKKPQEKGLYLNPELYNQSKDKSLNQNDEKNVTR